MYTKVVGVTFSNKDGTSRQTILKSMEKTALRGDYIELRREPENPYDKYTIAVYNKDGAQLGYLNTNTASDYAEYMDTGGRVNAELDKIIGGDEHSYGCIIDISVRGIKCPGGRSWDINSRRSKEKSAKQRLLSWGKIILGFILFSGAINRSLICTTLFTALVIHWGYKIYKSPKRRSFWSYLFLAFLIMLTIGLIVDLFNRSKGVK